MLKFYNTLSRQKEEFVPIGNKVTMYSCGPTVYNYAHIGNMRSYIFMDILRRTLLYNGYKLKGVMNITDVGHLLSDADEGEDKLEKAGREQNKSPFEIAEFYTNAFFADLKKLNIQKPELTPKATDHIQDMINYVLALQEKGYAYETDDGIYFDISKFPEYGKLSRLNLDDQIAGARVEVNSFKRHPADFALWKKAPKNHIMQWESPWGMGYPGWHIECSAMSKKYLGKVFDIHTGGVDHIPVHHENEIAQSESLEGCKTVNYWLHGEFMLVDGGKMSKSLGNTYTISQLEEMGYSAMDFRYFCLNAHYRKKLNFTFEGLKAAQTAYKRLLESLYEHKISPLDTPDTEIQEIKQKFLDAINDDLNLPLALGIVWTALKNPPSHSIYEMCLDFDKVIALSFDKAAPAEKNDVEIDEETRAIAERRFEARKNKDWKLSDELREELKQRGYAVEDRKDGYELKKI